MLIAPASHPPGWGGSPRKLGWCWGRWRWRFGCLLCSAIRQPTPLGAPRAPDPKSPTGQADWGLCWPTAATICWAFRLGGFFWWGCRPGSRGWRSGFAASKARCRSAHNHWMAPAVGSASGRIRSASGCVCCCSCWPVRCWNGAGSTDWTVCCRGTQGVNWAIFWDR